tara:strand:- start:466 stop:1671 length:1206 start_codon:yes stop_codon:yes gene_type:complete
MKTINNFKLSYKKVLVRVDLNVPVTDGLITERSRIHAIKLTVKKLQEKKSKIFLLSHFGRPKGKRDVRYSLKFICETLKEEFGLSKIFFLDNLKDDEIQKIIIQMQPGDICLFENIRFYEGEENNNSNFIKKLCNNFDIFINDAFSASHRNHASIVSAPKYLPSFAGYNMEKEIKNIELFFNNSKKPNLAIIGGSKISTKIDMLYNLAKFFDTIVIGGAMANTFLYAKNIDIGKSLCEKNLSETAISIINHSKKYHCKIILPLDVVCADNFDDKINIRRSNINNILNDQMVLDLGVETIELISRYIVKSNTILWNGPLGAFEHKPFDHSSVSIANIIKNNFNSFNKYIVAGGGDTISVIKLAKAEDGFSYISKAGGAFLEWLEGKKSPGVKALLKNNYSST